MDTKNSQKYIALVRQYIRERYSDDDVIQIERDAVNGICTYKLVELDKYREECKARAKMELGALPKDEQREDV